MAKLHLITIEPGIGLQLHPNFDPWPIIIDYVEIQKFIDNEEYEKATIRISMHIEGLLQEEINRHVKRQLGRLYTLAADVEELKLLDGE